MLYGGGEAHLGHGSEAGCAGYSRVRLDVLLTHACRWSEDACKSKRHARPWLSVAVHPNGDIAVADCERNRIVLL